MYEAVFLILPSKSPKTHIESPKTDFQEENRRDFSKMTTDSESASKTVLGKKIQKFCADFKIFTEKLLI